MILLTTRLAYDDADAAESMRHDAEAAGRRLGVGREARLDRAAAPRAQWKESPQAQEPVALGLSIVKPCFSMESTKSIIAPLR